MSNVNNWLVDQIQRHEGYRQFPYKDSEGILTIGIGRNLESVGIREDEAEFLAKNDLELAENNLWNEFTWYDNLSIKRKQALINLVFNIGIAGLKKFKKFLLAMESGNWQLAHDELLDSKYAQQVKGRATEIAKQILVG